MAVLLFAVPHTSYDFFAGQREGTSGLPLNLNEERRIQVKKKKNQSNMLSKFLKNGIGNEKCLGSSGT